MSQDVIHEVCYLIGYRQSTADRKKGLQFLLNWLYRYFPELEVLLIEQDAATNLDFELPSNCRHFFIYNPGLYNRCWAFNVGVNLTAKRILAFADSDMFLYPEDYLRSFLACRQFEAVNPNGSYTYNVVDTDHEALTYTVSQKRKLWTYAAGLMLMQRQAFERIGGWDERFEGWGVEDNEISHVIGNSLSNISLNYKMYHVDHARGVLDGKSQPNYLYNRALFDEISLLFGPALDRYLEIRRNSPRGNTEKYVRPAGQTTPAGSRFVLAIMPVLYGKELEHMLESWLNTCDKTATWTLIISNDRQDAEQLDFLNTAGYDNIEKIFLDHHGQTHIHRYNEILLKLKDIPFDLCFHCRESIMFLKPGWDYSYWQVIERTGLGHLCFYDRRESRNALPEPVIKGDLACHVAANLDIQHSLFTVVPAMINEIGYLDAAMAGEGRLEFLDYSFRSFRKGFNVYDHPFDLRNSNDFFLTQRSLEVSIKNSLKWVSIDEKALARRRNIIYHPRTYISLNDLLPHLPDDQVPEESESFDDEPGSEPSGLYVVNIDKRLKLDINNMIEIVNKEYYTKADSAIHWKAGAFVVIMGVTKKFYNFLLKCRMGFLIRFFDRLANLFIRAGMAFKNIDYK